MSPTREIGTNAYDRGHVPAYRPYGWTYPPVRPDQSGLWQHIPTLGGTDPLIVAETDGFEEGDGMRVILFPHHVLVETAGDGGAYMLIPLETLLDAVGQMNKQVGS